jgi:hypothetical protein
LKLVSDVQPQKSTFANTLEGNAWAAARAFRRETVPIEAVGQATSAAF